MREIERVVGLLDGDPANPADTIARCDARLVEELHRRWFGRVPLLLCAGLRRRRGAAPPLGRGDLVLAGGAAAASVAAAATPALFLLSLHTPGGPAKHLLPEVRASYQVEAGAESAAVAEKRERVLRGLERCSLLCTNSRWTAGVLRATYAPLLGSCFPPVCPECVGLDLPPKEGARPPRAAAGPAVLVSMVRASPRKRWPGLVETARRLERARPGSFRWHVLCGGDQPEIAARVGRGAAPGLVLHPWVSEEEKRRLLRSASVFVHPAHCEHLGLGLLEALAHRVPVVASRSGGPPTYLREGMHAAFFAPDDWADLAVTVLSLLDDRARGAAMARAGEERVREHFGWEAVLGRLGACLAERGWGGRA